MPLHLYIRSLTSSSSFDCSIFVIHCRLSADLLLLLWPIFFISASRQDPHLKGRNFKKSVTRGSDRVVDLTRRVNNASLDLPHRLRRKTGDRKSNATDEDEERPPAWETGGTLPAYGQQVGTVRRCCWFCREWRSWYRWRYRHP